VNEQEQPEHVVLAARDRFKAYRALIRAPVREAISYPWTCYGTPCNVCEAVGGRCRLCPFGYGPAGPGESACTGVTFTDMRVTLINCERALDIRQAARARVEYLRERVRANGWKV
jgi:hypothetical protein